MQRSAIYSCLAFLAILTPLNGQPRRVTPVTEGNRVALVIGNDQYLHIQPLSNSGNDARSMAAALRGLKFKVIERENAAREVFDEAVDEFIHQLHPGDTALFYYSGHGMQIGGENYLAAVDLNAGTEVQARNRALKAGEILEEMESSGAVLNIVVLDACRDNPFGSGRSIGGQGLAQMNGGKGTLIAYATAPGHVADDNRQGSNGIYTFYLLQALKEPGLALEQVFKRTGAMVQQASGGRQVPWISSSVGGDFYFSAGTSSLAAGPQPTNTQRISVDRPSGSPPDVEAWEAIRTSTDPELFKQFLQEFPSSAYAGTARLKLSSLTPRSAPAPANQSPGTSSSPGSASSEAPRNARQEQASAMVRNKALNDAYNAGTTAAAQKQWDVAIGEFTKAAEIDPLQAVVWAHLGEAYLGRGKPSDNAQAAEAYAHASSFNPSDAGLHNNYAIALARIGKLSEAEAEWGRAAQLDPGKAGQYFFNLGAILTNAGRTDQAVTVFKQAFLADPNYADAYYQYGVGMLAKSTTDTQGHVNAPTGTREAFEKYLQLAPNGPYATNARDMLRLIAR